MALDAIIRDGTSGVGAGVNADNELAVALPQEPTGAGWVKVAGGDGQPALLSRDGHILVGRDQLAFYDQVDGTAVNTNLWLQSNLTMTTTQTGGLLGLNATLITTVNTYAIVSTIKQFALYGTQPVTAHFGAIVNTTPEANATIELGIGAAATTAAPTDGVFFRWSPAGEFLGVMNYGGIETTTPLTPPSINVLHNYQVVVDNDVVTFRVDGETAGTVTRPAAQPFPVATARLPAFARVFNAGSAPATAPRLQIGSVVVTQGVLDQNRPWPTALASIGRGAYQSPITTFAQTTNFTNSTGPTSATLSNTAAGYTTLGGKFQFAAPAGAVTDFALFGYQVPAGYQLYVTRVDITCVNTGAAVATTATILDWGVGVNASAVSLATADGSGTWAPRRRTIGVQGWVVGDAIGKAGDDLTSTFDPPLVVDSGRFFHVILQVPVGTATASQVMRGAVSVHGYFE